MAAFKAVFILNLLGLTGALGILMSSRSSFPTQGTTPNIRYNYVTEPGEFGTFSSPNYPSAYPSNVVYVYQIGHAREPVRIVFNRFSLQYCPGCKCDNVTITTFVSPEKQVYCGDELPNGNGIVQVMGPAIVTMATSNAYNEYQGFQAEYQIGGMTTTFNVPTAATCLPPVCPYCHWPATPKIHYEYSCPFCDCGPGPTASTLSTGPTERWTTGPRASTYPPSSTTPSKGILSSLFRIHGELSDLQDRARQADNDIIDLIQQIEGNTLGEKEGGAILDSHHGNGNDNDKMDNMSGLIG